MNLHVTISTTLPDLVGAKVICEQTKIGIDGDLEFTAIMLKLTDGRYLELFPNILVEFQYTWVKP